MSSFSSMSIWFRLRQIDAKGRDTNASQPLNFQREQSYRLPSFWRLSWRSVDLNSTMPCWRGLVASSTPSLGTLGTKVCLEVSPTSQRDRRCQLTGLIHSFASSATIPSSAVNSSSHSVSLAQPQLLVFTKTELPKMWGSFGTNRRLPVREMSQRPEFRKSRGILESAYQFPTDCQIVMAAYHLCDAHSISAFSYSYIRHLSTQHHAQCKI